jgi:hypothetical protein
MRFAAARRTIVICALASAAACSDDAPEVREDGAIEVCREADRSEVLASAEFTDPDLRWVFCAGEPDSDVVLSLRSEDRGEWTSRDVPITHGHHAGDVAEIHIADRDRAWATHDGLVSEGHRHVWTIDGGQTWRSESDEADAVTASSCDRPPPTPEIVRAETDLIVQVFLICGGYRTPPDLIPVQRVVPNDGAPLRAALTQLFLGLTPQEADAGLQSIFSAFTTGGLRGVTVEGGLATIDLTSGFESTNNFGTAASSGAVVAQLQATVFQFPEINGIELQVEGERWCGWESVCEDQPVPLFRREA